MRVLTKVALLRGALGFTVGRRTVVAFASPRCDVTMSGGRGNSCRACTTRMCLSPPYSTLFSSVRMAASAAIRAGLLSASAENTRLLRGCRLLLAAVRGLPGALLLESPPAIVEVVCACISWPTYGSVLVALRHTAGPSCTHQKQQSHERGFPAFPRHFNGIQWGFLLPC